MQFLLFPGKRDAVMSDMGPLSGAKRTFGQTAAVSAEFIVDSLGGDESA
jgi:hypothetical protein